MSTLEKTSPIGPTIIRYGLIGGLIFVVYSLLGNLIGFSRPSAGIASVVLNGLISLAIYIGLLVVAVRHFRDKENGGAITFGKAFMIGLGVALITAIINGLFTFIYVSYIEPDYLETTMRDMESLYESFGLTEDQMEEALKKARESMTPTAILRNSVIYSLVFGSIVSAIVAAIMKRQPQPEI